MLLSLGADAEAADNNGHLPADKAKQLKHERTPASSERPCTHGSWPERPLLAVGPLSRRSRGPPACSGFPLRLSLRGAPERSA
jgi:hypothetical protein